MEETNLQATEQKSFFESFIERVNDRFDEIECNLNRTDAVINKIAPGRDLNPELKTSGDEMGIYYVAKSVELRLEKIAERTSRQGGVLTELF